LNSIYVVFKMFENTDPCELSYLSPMGNGIRISNFDLHIHPPGVHVNANNGFKATII